MHYELWTIVAGAVAGLACGFFQYGRVVGLRRVVADTLHYAFQTH